jgi:hypothetical protein
MSRTNDMQALCDRCRVFVPAGQGTLRFWNGAARKHAPAWAKRNAFGVYNACHCVDCERELGN